VTTDADTIELNICLDLIGLSSTDDELNWRYATAIQMLSTSVQPPHQLDNRRLVSGGAHLLIVQMLAQGGQVVEFYCLSERLSQDCISGYYPAQGQGLLLGGIQHCWDHAQLRGVSSASRSLSVLIRG
jgi:hypothetical protein